MNDFDMKQEASSSLYSCACVRKFYGIYKEGCATRKPVSDQLIFARINLHAQM